MCFYFSDGGITKIGDWCNYDDITIIIEDNDKPIQARWVIERLNKDAQGTSIQGTGGFGISTTTGGLVAPDTIIGADPYDLVLKAKTTDDSDQTLWT